MMGNERLKLPKRMLLARTEEGQRNKGRPRKSWAELARDDLVHGNTGGTGAARI